MLKIAVLISGGGSNLQSLIDNCANHIINGEIKLVISNRKDAYGLKRAEMADIKTLFTKDQNLLLNILREEEIDLIVLAGYLAIISSDLISEYENRIINIHPSLIPSFCGKGFYGHHVHDAVFKRGNKISGATVHFVSEVVDGGPIILQEAVDIADCKNAEEIAAKVLVIEHQLLPKAVSLYCDNKLEIINERVKIK